MKSVYPIFILIWLYLPQNVVLAQNKVGLVLSGGGAGAIAHIGVLKALEENNIPIDYITGTSMGAMIGAFYACGLSPWEMEAMVTSEKFQLSSTGEIEDKYKYFFNISPKNASWISLHFSRQNLFRNTLPTNLISPAALDYELIKIFSQHEARATYNFDNLFIPFRCVAADIENKKPVIFNSGSLSQAVRASSTYPFYISPITVDGNLLFDGGIYNNFPSDIMDQDFNPDFIIGSKVSTNFEPPHEDDLLSQLKNMLVSKTGFDFPTEQCLMIEPNDLRGTFNFYNLQEVIDSGYAAAMRQMSTLKSSIDREVSNGELFEKRTTYKKELPPFVLGNVSTYGIDKNESKYVNKLIHNNLKKNKSSLSIDKFEPIYYRLNGDDKISSVYPTTKFNDSLQQFDLALKIKREQDFEVSFGGNFSNRPINVGFVGLKYNLLRNQSLTFEGNSYFGAFYASALGLVRVKMPWRMPLNGEISYTRNRWNYYKSRATFFEDKKPSYVLQYENNIEFALNLPLNNNSRIRLSSAFNTLIDEYYQTKNFTSVDTADITRFNGSNIALEYEKNSLNRILYASSGSYFNIRVRYIDGIESHIPGSTSPQSNQFTELRQWVQARAVFDNYYKQRGRLRLGLYAEGVYSTQELFNNYTASILRSPVFEPIAESRTLFLETFRAYQFIAIGHKVVFSIRDNLDLRLECYIFQPFARVVGPDLNQLQVRSDIARRFTIASANAVYHSPLGPLSLSVNYYLNEPEVGLEPREPITFLFHFGYIIFNKRAHY